MNDQLKKLPLLAIIQVIVFVLIVPFLPLLISWHWNWWEAWVFALLYILGFVISRALAARRHPDLLGERALSMQQSGTVSWDKILAPLVGLGGNLVPLVAGLDALFGWSPAFSLPIKILALLVLVAGYILGAYALIENRFFSGVVRIQSDRGQQVVATGPYAWVRHPGYAGALWSYLVMPAFLDSSWAYLPAVVLAIAVIVRTSLEDRFLQDNLEGYRDYARRVRYRLVPGIW